MIDFPPDVLERIRAALKIRGATEATVKLENGQVHIFAVVKKEIK